MRPYCACRRARSCLHDIVDLGFRKELLDDSSEMFYGAG